MLDRRKLLQIMLVITGALTLFVYPLMLLWPSGWRWEPHQSQYEQMLAVVYAVLGIFLLRAARKPEEHLSLIWFTVWSNLAHGGLMAVQAAKDPMEHGHFLGDVPALLVGAIVLAVLTPRKTVG